jgi:hypothetical protein
MFCFWYFYLLLIEYNSTLQIFLTIQINTQKFKKFGKGISFYEHIYYIKI